MNIYGKITHYFLKNKQLSVLLMLGVMLWGGISFWVMPKQYNPDIVAPAFSITADFPGATVDEVYQVVTKPLEDVLHEMPGVDNIYSRSVHGGRSEVIVEFFVGEDMAESMINLRQKISSRLNLKPLGVSEPFIATIDPEDLPIMTVALYSEKINPIEIRKRAFFLRDRLKHAKGVSIAEVIGGRQREFQIILDPQKMKETKTSLSEIDHALNGTSVLRNMGLIKAPEAYYQIETQEQVISTTDIENIIIVSNVDSLLRVKDVATVIESAKEVEDYVGYYTATEKYENAVYLTFAKKKGENIVAVCRTIDRTLETLKKTEPYLQDLSVTIVKDEGRVASEEIRGLVVNLIQAIAVVFFILLVFLNIRAALIVAMSIPLTLLAVFAIGNLFGFTINRITLFALILSLGLLVDSATVVIENIVKNKQREPDLDHDLLIARSVSEVGMGLLLSTLTTVLAFIPMFYVTGMMGPYMGPLPFFVSSALLISLLFAYTLNPWLASLLCKKDTQAIRTVSCGVLCRLLQSGRAAYSRLLDSLLSRTVLRRVFLLVSFTVLIGVLLFPVFKFVRFRMLPKADREQLYVYVDLNRGVSIEKTKSVADDFVETLLSQQDVTSVQSFVGTPPVVDFNGLFRGVSARRESHQFTLKVNMSHPSQRAIPSERLAARYRDALEKEKEKYPEARITIVEDPPGPPVRATFYVKIKSEDPELLREVTYDLERKVQGIKEVKDIDVSLPEKHEKYILSVDKVAAANAKINVETISNELSAIFGERIIGVYHSDYNYEQEYIVLTFRRDVRDDIKDLDHVYVMNSVGNHVPVSRFIRSEKVADEDDILGDNRERVAYISGEMGKRSVTYAAIDMLSILASYSLAGHAVERESFGLLSSSYRVDGSNALTIEVSGEWQVTVEVFRDLGIAMAVAIVLIYLVLVAQFRSFILPILIMITIPLALNGVFPGFMLLFHLKRVYFSATSMIGVIALAGIVVNNAIIFLEYTLEKVKEMSTLKETLLDAGLTRMRPILLTSITTIFGSLFIATDPVWSGLSWAIVFGLSLSALLTLIVFPVLVYEFLGEKWFIKMHDRAAEHE
jgi:multidrug efflux pump subunit AcrB